MRYEELPGPLEGWTYDETGTIHTASGYRCDARTLECALWLFQCYGGEARRYLITSDEAPGALRPLYESSDADRTGEIKPTRLQLEKRSPGGERVQGRKASTITPKMSILRRTAVTPPLIANTKVPPKSNTCVSSSCTGGSSFWSRSLPPSPATASTTRALPRRVLRHRLRAWGAAPAEILDCGWSEFR